MRLEFTERMRQDLTPDQFKDMVLTAVTFALEDFKVTVKNNNGLFVVDMHHESE